MLLGAVCEYYLGGRRDLVDVLKLRLMRWEVSLDYPGTSDVITRVFTRKREAEEPETEM